MSRVRSKIRTKSYIHLTPDGEKVCLRDVSEHQRNYLGALMKTKFLNELYAGEIHFWIDDIERGSVGE